MVINVSAMIRKKLHCDGTCQFRMTYWQISSRMLDTYYQLMKSWNTIGPTGVEQKKNGQWFFVYELWPSRNPLQLRRRTWDLWIIEEWEKFMMLKGGNFTTNMPGLMDLQLLSHWPSTKFNEVVGRRIVKLQKATWPGIQEASRSSKTKTGMLPVVGKFGIKLSLLWGEFERIVVG